MGLSILLIVIFQFYWLRKLFHEEKQSFAKTTELSFRETIYRLQAERFRKDSFLFRGTPGENIFISDMVSEIRSERKLFDSTKRLLLSINRSEFKDRPAYHKDTTIIIGSDKHPGNPPEVMRFLKSNSTINRPLPIRLIDSAYSAQLKKDGIDIPYIIKIIVHKPDSTPAGFATPVIPVGLIKPTYYQALFKDPTPVLLTNLLPQFLISLLLVSLITLSFIFIYRNLVAQQKLTAIKNEFIANITHELKTPISTVSVAIEAMKNFNALNNPQRTEEYLGIAKLELNRLSLLVDKVLRLSMFENRQVELDPATFSMSELVEEVMASMDLQFQKCGASVEFLKEGDNFNIAADRMHISSVIYNLLDNALKYCKETPVIRIQLSENQNDLVLSVADNGIGIDPVFKDKVFDKFFRVPSGNTHNVKGYGLGLSYAAHIVEKHQGSIRVESDGKTGTTFIIQLPKQYAS